MQTLCYWNASLRTLLLMYGTEGLRKGIYGPEVSHWKLAVSRLRNIGFLTVLRFVLLFSLLTSYIHESTLLTGSALRKGPDVGLRLTVFYALNIWLQYITCFLRTVENVRPSIFSNL